MTPFFSGNSCLGIYSLGKHYRLASSWAYELSPLANAVLKMKELRCRRPC